MVLIRNISVCLLAILSLLFVSTNLNAQNSNTSRQAVYVELGGAGYVYSFNYEYYFNNKFSLRIGGMFLRYTEIERNRNENRYQGIIVPVIANRFFGKNSHKFELGAGFLLQDFRVENDLPDRTERFIGIFDTNTGGIGLAGVIGYRYQPLEEGFLFRLSLSLDAAPGFDYDLSGAFGLSVGFIF